MEQGVAVNVGVPTSESPAALEIVPTAESPMKNKGVPTAESPTALDDVPTAESPIKNKGVPTAESPTALEVVPTAESPTPRKCRDEREIYRNARNLLVTLGHMTNEGDESQVKSLSPSNINI